MLVLSRKLDQSIVVGGNIKIQVLKVSGNTVRIGIEAPKDVKILRGELAPFGIDETEGTDPSDSDEKTSTPEMLTMDLELSPEELQRLPNPFAVAHAS